MPATSSQSQAHKLPFLFGKNIEKIYKPLVFIGVLLLIFYILLSNGLFYQSPQYLARLRQDVYAFYDDNQVFDHSHPTNISHLMIGIAGSVRSWKSRKPYIESWWQPNVTKGYLFLDRNPTSDFLPWPTSSPPYRISENTSRYKPYDKHLMPHAIRMVRVITETFKVSPRGIRWFVMADDDTILFLDNLVEVLSRYDHNKYFYIGQNSECVRCNFDNSFGMAFGGAGYALSYPLAKALAKNLDVCIKRYPFLYGSDHILQSCVADMGVSLTQEKGFHQVDLHKDLSGFLSSHPHTPFISLHHLDTVDPIFPFMNKSEALNHLQKVANIDQSRLLQQTICYEKSKSWSFSVAWGYSVQVYEKIIPPSILEKPLETFSAWTKPSKSPGFMFNTRPLSNNPCEMPHFFFLESIEKDSKNKQVISRYTRKTPPMTMTTCSSSSSTRNGSFSAQINDLAEIIVFSPTTKYNAMAGTRRECCVIIDQVEMNSTRIKYRTCKKNEILGVD